MRGHTVDNGTDEDSKDPEYPDSQRYLQSILRPEISRREVFREKVRPSMNTPRKATEGPPKRRKRVDRSSLPEFTFHRFRCPACNGTRFRREKMRSVYDEVDGVSIQEKVCYCGFRFRLFLV